MKEITSLKEFEKLSTKIISARWNGSPVLVKVRALSPLQMKAIGSFSLIKIFPDVPVKDARKIAEGLELQHRLVKAALVSPTYAEIFKIAELGDFSKETEKTIHDIESEIVELPKGPQRSELEQQVAWARMLYELLLPNDFVSDITKVVTKQDDTEIHLVTKEILLECGTKAHQYGGRPSDFCSGILSDFNNDDIDDRAEEVYQIELAKHRKKAKNAH